MALKVNPISRAVRNAMRKLKRPDSKFPFVAPLSFL